MAACVALTVRWGGHTFQLASVYLPPATRPAQFIQQRLQPLAAQGPLLMGRRLELCGGTPRWTAWPGTGARPHPSPAAGAARPAAP
jgi:hypothetical protein